MNERENINLARLHSDMQSVLWGEPYYEYIPEDIDQFRKKSDAPNVLSGYDVLAEASALIAGTENSRTMQEGKKYELPIDYISEAFE